MPKHKIAILFEYPTLNGGERSILSMIADSNRPLYEFVAIAPLSGRLARKLKELDLPHLPYDFRDGNGLKLSQERLQNSFRKIVSVHNIDLLHANSLAMGRLTGSLVPQLSIQCTAHLRDMMKLSRSAMSHLNRNAKLVAVSSATRDFHIAQGLEPSRCATIYNGIDSEEFMPGKKSGDLKKELGIRDDAFLILNAGQICLRKAQDVLVKAFAEVADRIPYAHLVLAGERYSTKQESVKFEQSLDETIRDARLEKRFHKLGFRDDIAAVMRDCDLLVHTARQEPLGRVLLEAATTRMPIIATDVGGTREILEHNFSAILLTTDNRSAFAEAMESLYRNPEKRNQLSTNAEKRIAEKFRLHDQREELFAMWNNLL